MAYNFDEAYSTDSFADSDWESICRHVGVNFTKEEGNDEDVKGSKTERKKRKSAETEKDKAHENDGSTGSREDNETVEIKSDEVRTEMKNLQKILKRGRSLLLNPNLADLNKTYEMFKTSSKIIKKQWKSLLKPDEANAVEESAKEPEVHPCPDDGARESKGMGEEAIAHEGEKKKKRKKKRHTLNEREMTDTRNEGKERKKENEIDDDTQVHKHDTRQKEKINRETYKPIHTSFQGHPRYLCPSCDFIGRSYGKAYGHMVEMHNVRVLGCERCPFATKNPTSLHNHRKLYCPKRNDK